MSILTGFDKAWADWLAAYRAAGHDPVMEDGRVDSFAYNPFDPHNGPECTTCGLGLCWHCTSHDEIPACEGVARKERLRLEHEESVLKEADEIRASREVL